MKTVISCRPWTSARFFLFALSALFLAWGPVAQAASVTLAWDRSSDATATGYKLYYTDIAAGTTSANDAGNGTSTTVSGLVDAKTYSFYVVAYNSSGGESLPSNVINYTVPGVNTPPTISNIANLSTTQNIPTSPIAFTVGDLQTAVGSLTVSAASSNPTLVPVGNIVFGGSGANRTVTVTPALNQTGTATITVTVSDGSLTANKSFVLTVNPSGPFTPVYLAFEAESGNLASPMSIGSDPNAGGGQYIGPTANEAGTATFTVNIPIAGTYVVWCRIFSDDLSRDSFYVSADGGTEYIYATALNRLSTTWQWTTVNAAYDGIDPRTFLFGAGTHTLVFRGREANTALDQLLVTNDPNFVPGANTAPTISNIADRSTSQSTSTGPIAFTVGDSQTAAGSLTVSASSSNPTLVPVANIVFGGSGANRTVTITPAPNLNGTATITVTVNDGSLTASDSFVLTVNAAANTVPTISSIANQTTTQSIATAPIAFTVSDEQTAASSLVVSGASSNPTLVPNANIVFGGSGASRTVTVTPALNQTGTATITVTVNDGSLTASKSFVLTVNPAGPFTPVYLTIEAESGALVYPISAYSDPSASGGNFITSDANNTGTATFTINIPVAGTYVVWCKVLSPDTGTDSFYVSADGGTEFIYATALNTLSSAWQWTAVNSAYDFIDPMTFQFGAGTHTLVFRGREAFTGLDQLLVTNDRSYVPGANTAPTISNMADLSTTQNTATAPIAFTVGDAQTAAGSLTVTRTSSNPTLVPTANIVLGGSGANRTVTVTPALNQTGTATITVTVSDGSLTASDSFVLTVNATVNTAPTISNIADLSTAQNTASAPIAFTVGDAQTAAGSLTVSGTSSNPTLVPAANIVLGGSGANRTVTVTPALNQSGTATITVTVSDGSLTVGDSFVLTVNAAVNTAPAISSIANQTTTQNTATAPIPFTVGDSQTAAGSLIVTASSSNPTLVPASNIVFGGSGSNRTVTVTPALNELGTATITMTVSDGNLTASTSFTLTADIIFRITAPPLTSSIQLDPAGSVTVTWPAVAGKNYRVMYKNNLTDSTWSRLHPDVRPDTNQASKSDYVVGNRFYQVIELP